MKIKTYDTTISGPEDLDYTLHTLYDVIDITLQGRSL